MYKRKTSSFKGSRKGSSFKRSYGRKRKVYRRTKPTYRRKWYRKGTRTYFRRRRGAKWFRVYKKAPKGAKIHVNKRPTTSKSYKLDRQRFKMTAYAYEDYMGPLGPNGSTPIISGGGTFVGEALDLNWLFQCTSLPNKAQPLPDVMLEYGCDGTSSVSSTTKCGSLLGFTDLIRTQGSGATPNYLSLYVSSVTFEWQARFVFDHRADTLAPTLPITFFTCPLSYEQYANMTAVASTSRGKLPVPANTTGTIDSRDYLNVLKQYPNVRYKTISMSDYKGGVFKAKRHITLKRFMPPGYPNSNPMPQTLSSTQTRTHYHILQGTDVAAPTDLYTAYMYFGYMTPPLVGALLNPMLHLESQFKMTVWFTCILPLVPGLGFHKPREDDYTVTKSGEGKESKEESKEEKKDRGSEGEDEVDEFTEEDMKQFMALKAAMSPARPPAAASSSSSSSSSSSLSTLARSPSPAPVPLRRTLSIIPK